MGFKKKKENANVGGGEKAANVDGGEKAANVDNAEKAAAENTPDDDKKAANEEKAAKKRYNRRRLKYGTMATAVTVVVIAAVVLVNVVVNLLADRVNMSIDLTVNGTFEISQETIDYLNTVNEPVTIRCMADEVEYETSSYIYFKQAYEVLKKYTYYSDNVSLEFVDMVKNPTYADRYKETYAGDIDSYSIVVESSKRIKVIEIQDLYNTQINYQTYSQEIVSSNAEQELTSAIMYVTDPDPLKAVIFSSETSGSSYDNVMQLLVKNGFEVTEIDPLSEAIPEDTDLVVVNAPLNDYETGIVDSLADFLDNGGKLGKNLIYIADASQKTTKNIDDFLAEWGMRVESGTVCDENTNNLINQINIVRDYISDSDFSANVAQTGLPVIDYQSRPITLLFDSKDTRTTLPLLQTADTGFIMTEEILDEITSGGNPDLNNSVLTTMAIGRKYIFDDDNNQVYSNVLVIGSSETLDEVFTSTTYYNNGEYFLSILNTMTGKTTGISIVAKDLTSPTFDIDLGTVNTYTTVFMIIIPIAVLVIGAVVFFKRRTM